MTSRMAEEAEFLRWLDAKYGNGRRLVPNPSKEEAKNTPRVEARKAYFHPEFRKKEEAEFLREKETRQKEVAGELSVAREHFSKAFQELRQGLSKLPAEKHRSAFLGSPLPGSSQEIRKIAQDIERRLLHLLARTQ